MMVPGTPRLLSVCSENHERFEYSIVPLVLEIAELVR
jgi:hypothetical protein